MEGFFKSIKKNLETLPGFNFLKFDEEEKLFLDNTDNTNNTNDDVINKIIDDSKYEKLVDNANANITEKKKRNTNTRKKRAPKSKTKNKPKK